MQNLAWPVQYVFAVLIRVIHVINETSHNHLLSKGFTCIKVFALTRQSLHLKKRSVTQEWSCQQCFHAGQGMLWLAHELRNHHILSKSSAIKGKCGAQIKDHALFFWILLWLARPEPEMFQDIPGPQEANQSESGFEKALQNLVWSHLLPDLSNSKLCYRGNSVCRRNAWSVKARGEQNNVDWLQQW